VMSMSVCVSVCLFLCEHIPGSICPTPIFNKFCVHVTYRRSPVLFWRRCGSDMLFISGFMDDVISQIYACNGHVVLAPSLLSFKNSLKNVDLTYTLFGKK